MIFITVKHIANEKNPNFEFDKCFFFYKQILLIRIGNKLFVNFVIKISSRIFDSNGYINITSVDSDF